MNDIVILGTDTEAGKTTFSLLWMATFSNTFEYWKPLETGVPDSATLAALVPAATIHRSLRHFAEPVAPLLASIRANAPLPSPRDVAARVPTPSNPSRGLLIETFGGPFSPFSGDDLQVEFLRHLARPCLLVTPSRVGAIGRTLQCLRALATEALVPIGVVLLGPEDSFAAEQIALHWKGGPVWSLNAPKEWNNQGVAHAAAEQIATLQAIRAAAARRLPEAKSPTRVEDWVARDRAAVWHPYTSLADPVDPLVCVAAHDEFLTLADGREVIDAISSWWTILHGHRHPRLLAALEEASQRLDHVVFAGMTHEPGIQLAELLLQSAPWPGGRVFYSDNGSTAVEVALKLAYQYWCHHGQAQRTRFVGFEGGYHGDTFGAMAISRDPIFFGRFEPMLMEASIVPLSPEKLEAELAQRGQETAAIIIEPLVQGAGGMLMHTPDTLRKIFEVARAYGVLVIADEVMTGNRTGRRWAHGHANVTPDLICAGKTLTGGLMPLAVTLVGPHIVEAFQSADRSRTFFHGHSFTAHPMACAMAVANCSIPLPPTTEAFWQKQLDPVKSLPQVREVRTRGTIAAVELAVEGGYLASIGPLLRRICLEHGVLCRPLGNVLYAMPPVGASQNSLRRIAQAMVAAVQAVPPPSD